MTSHPLPYIFQHFRGLYLAYCGSFQGFFAARIMP